MRALCLTLFAVLVTGCTSGGAQWPLGPASTTPASATTAAAFDYCPSSDSTVTRVRATDGAQLVPMRYVRSEPGKLCVVTPGGAQRWQDLLGMRFYQADEPQVQPLARALASLFPLQVGKKASTSITGITTGGMSYMWTFDFEVVGTERISIQAGPFDTFVIRLRERGQAPNAFSADAAVWVEPRSRLPLRVRNQVNMAENHGRFIDWDAISILTR